MARWTFDDIPCQAGRTAVVTGANSGLGFESARQLALKGANVIAACRHRDKGREAVRRIRDESRTQASRRRRWIWPIWTPSPASPTSSWPGIADSTC
jgi:NAD(P)-dependent dehydrogenase (short-subunit alcohol dehydrogenase family)